MVGYWKSINLVRRRKVQTMKPNADEDEEQKDKRA
jgi:hypothetical protein